MKPSQGLSEERSRVYRDGKVDLVAPEAKKSALTHHHNAGRLLSDKQVARLRPAKSFFGVAPHDDDAGGDSGHGEAPPFLSHVDSQPMLLETRVPSVSSVSSDMFSEDGHSLDGHVTSPPEREVEGEFNPISKPDGQDGTGSRYVFKLLEQLDVGQIERIHEVFEKHGGTLTCADFTQSVCDALRLSHHEKQQLLTIEEVSRPLSEVFARLDLHDTGYVKWDSFCDFILYGQEAENAIAKDEEITQYQSQPSIRERSYDEEIDRVVYSRELNKLLTCHKNGLASVWNPQSGELIHRLKGHDSAVLDILHAPSESQHEGRIVTSATDRTIAVWSDSYILMGRWDTEVPQLCLAWNKDHSMLYSGGTDGCIRAYSLKNKAGEDRDASCDKIFPAMHTEWISALVYSKHLKGLISTSLDGSVMLWNTTTGNLLRQYSGHKMSVFAVCYNNQRKILVTGGREHDLFLWSPFLDTLTQKLSGHKRPVISIMSHGNELISADTAGRILIWDLRTFANVQQLRGSPSMGSAFNTCCFDSERHSIITIGRSFAFYRSLSKYDDAVAAYQPVSRVLYNDAFHNVLLFAGAEVSLWRARDGKLISTYTGWTKAEIVSACFDPLQRCVLIVDSLGVISVYNVSTGVNVQSFRIIRRTQHDEVTMRTERVGGAAKHTEDARVSSVKKELDRLEVLQGGARTPAAVPEDPVEERPLTEIAAAHHLGEDTICVAGVEGELCIFDISCPGLERLLYIIDNQASFGHILSTAFDPEVSLLTVGGSGHFRVFTMDTLNSVHTEILQYDVTACAFALAAGVLLIGGSSHRVMLYNTTTYLPVCGIALGPSAMIARLEYCAGGNFFLTVHHDALHEPLKITSWSLSAIAKQVCKDLSKVGIHKKQSKTLPVVPSGLSKVYKASAELLAHSWVVRGNDDPVMLAPTTTGCVAGVIIGFDDGHVRVYSPHGVVYGALTLAGDPSYKFPLNAAGLKGDVHVRLGEKGSGVKGLGDNAARAFTRHGGVFDTEVADVTMRERTPRHVRKPLPVIEGSPPATRDPSTPSPGKLSFTSDRERYLEAVSPFFGQLQRSSKTPDLEQPFFLKGAGRSEVAYQRSTGNFAALARARREAESHQFELHTLQQWKEYFISDQRRSAKKATQYAPTYEKRAERLDLSSNDWHRRGRAKTSLGLSPINPVTRTAKYNIEDRASSIKMAPAPWNGANTVAMKAEVQTKRRVERLAALTLEDPSFLANFGDVAKEEKRSHTLPKIEHIHVT